MDQPTIEYNYLDRQYDVNTKQTSDIDIGLQVVFFFFFSFFLDFMIFSDFECYLPDQCVAPLRLPYNIVSLDIELCLHQLLMIIKR